MGRFVLKEIDGDLFSAKTTLAHCVGADLKMGMGIAVKFKQLFGGEAELRNQNVCFRVYFKGILALRFIFQGQDRRMCSAQSQGPIHLLSGYKR